MLRLSHCHQPLKIHRSPRCTYFTSISLSAPRLMHILRCAPCINHPLLLTHDSVAEGISIITNSCLSDIHWLLASLQIRDGGLGIRRVSWLALRLLGCSREHAGLTGPYASRLQRQSRHSGRVSAGHLKLIQCSSLPKRHRCSSSTIMGRTRHDT